MTPQHQITRRIVQDKSRAIEAQKFYLDLLHRYLSSQVGPQHSVILMRSYCDVLTKLKEMRQILLPNHCHSKKKKNKIFKKQKNM